MDPRIGQWGGFVWQMWFQGKLHFNAKGPEAATLNRRPHVPRSSCARIPQKHIIKQAVFKVLGKAFLLQLPSNDNPRQRIPSLAETATLSRQAISTHQSGLSGVSNSAPLLISGYA